MNQQRQQPVVLRPGHMGRGRGRWYIKHDMLHTTKCLFADLGRRAAELQQKHFNFALNEIGLHGSMEGHPGSAHTCPRMTTAIVMRPPVERVASHLAHIRGSLNTTCVCLLVLHSNS